MIARKLTFVALAVAASLACAGCRPAIQGVGNQGGPPAVYEKTRQRIVPYKRDANFIPAQLLMAVSVQKDLGLTADQIGEILDFVTLSRDLSRELAAKWPAFSASDIPGGISEARGLELKAWIETSASKQKEWMAKVVGMLTPSQRERLAQIELQQRIAVALLEPELIKALDISNDQLAKIRPLSDRNAEEQIAQLRDLDGLTAKDRHKRMIELAKERDKARAAANRRALDALKPEQRAKLETYVGKEIEVIWDYDTLVPDDGRTLF